MLAPILGRHCIHIRPDSLLCAVWHRRGGIAYNYVFRRLQPSWSALAITCGFEALLTILPFALGDRLALVAAEQAQSATELFWSRFRLELHYLHRRFAGGIGERSAVSAFDWAVGARTKDDQRAPRQNVCLEYVGCDHRVARCGLWRIAAAERAGLWQAIAGVLAVLSVGTLIGAPRIDRRTVSSWWRSALATFGCMFAEGPTAAWRHGGIGAGRAGLSLSDAERRRKNG